MTGKRAKNSMKIRTYTQARSLLGVKPVDIHRDVCDIYGDGQMSHWSVCRWVTKFKVGVMQRNDPPLQNDPRVISLRREMTHGSLFYVEK